MTKVKSLALLILSLLILNSPSKSQTKKNIIKINRIMLNIPDSLTHKTSDIANYINQEFNNPNEKARAIFFWIAENIQYDFNNRYAINMYNSETSTNETLKFRKGVCMNYAHLYSDIANKVGVKTYVVTGYTRKKNRVNPNPHAWCASMIDSSWYMIDPTWGSGHIQNSQYVKEINTKFFMIDPINFIKTHIPFDPLWQFLYYPLSKQEFYDGVSKSENEKTYFSFIDTLKVYEKQLNVERLLSSSKRIELNGICSYLDYINLYNIRFNIRALYKKIDEKNYKTAFNYYNDGIYLLNEYISYANKYYLPYKSDSEIKQMLTDIKHMFNLATAQLVNNTNRTSALENEVFQLEKSINQALMELKKQEDSLDNYLKIAKKYRETLSNSSTNK